MLGRKEKAQLTLSGTDRLLSFCSGGIAKLAKAASLQGAIAGSKPAPASNFAVLVSADTPTETFNHAQSTLYGPKQPRLYALWLCLSKNGETAWTPESKKVLK